MRRLSLPRTATALLAVAAAAGCGGSQASLHASAPERGLREHELRGLDDPMVKGGRMLPEAVGEGRRWVALPETLVEAPGGGTRSIVAGERVVSWPDGAIAAAPDRLPATPSTVVEVPERMGGGFLFAMDARLWRADSWLARAQPLLTTLSPIGQVQLGLDRIYLRTPQGALVAVDPRRGALANLGPLPASPAIGRIVALDAWRAVVVADLRGALLTLDAGSTWRPLALPIDPGDVVPLTDSIAIGGLDEARQTQWWEVRPDGQVGRLGGSPGSGGEAASAPAQDPAVRTFGARPLVAAIEDGWPLTDGTALVARDGALGRVLLSSGALVESVPDAFPMKPARCHPVSLARPRDPDAFGFVCGESRGRTVVYRFAAAEGRLVELRRFDDAREVLGFGNGALAARGPCAPAPVDDAPADDQAWCLMPPGGAWSEMHFRGEDVDRARLVVLHDGRVALVRPPRGEDLSTMRVTLTDGARSTHVPVVMPQMRADVARALRVGLWMDGFEERRDGVLGGWVDAGGSVAGVEIALDGQATVGSYIRAASDVFVSGRWGLGWTASRRGMETVDGGMSWKDLDVPEPIVPARATRERACGPVGCLAGGWMRVGWGEPEKPATKEPPPRTPVQVHAATRLELDCEATAGKPPEPRPRVAQGRTAAERRIGPPFVVTQPPTVPLGRFGPGLSSISMPGLAELPPFMARPAPAMGTDDAGDSLEVTSGIERSLGTWPLARVYAWGPKSGDWDQLGRWGVRWDWPFGGWNETRSTAVTQAPWTSLDTARRALRIDASHGLGWLLAAGDDADHALLVTRRGGGGTSCDVLALEADRAPVDVHPPGGDAFPEVEAATRIAGRWYLATQQAPGELAATVVWRLDGNQARELARVPRAGSDARSPLRMARRMDARALGLVVDGQGVGERAAPARWVASVDLESGAVGEPEPLAPVDLSDRPVTLCKGEDSGWQVDLPYGGQVLLRAGTKWQSTLQAPFARLRLSRDRACVERFVGTVDSAAATMPGVLARTSPAPAGLLHDARAIEVAASSARTRYVLRCTRR